MIVGSSNNGLILSGNNEPAVIFPMPENPNKVVLASIEDVPNSLYSLEIKIKLKPKNTSLPVYKKYSNVTKVSILNKNLLEIILSIPGDIPASLIYVFLYDIEDFNINFVSDTDDDAEIIYRKIWNIKEDKDNVN